MGFEQVGLEPGSSDGDAAGTLPWPHNGQRGERGGMGGPLKVILIPRRLGQAPDPEQLAQAGIALHEQLADVSTIAENSPLLGEADALVVQVDPSNTADMDAFDRLIHLAAGDVGVIAAVDGLTVANTRTLLRAGALDALPIPFSAEELKQAVEPARRAMRPAVAKPVAAPKRQGRMIAFIGALGGVGTTSIAVQLGVLWAASSRVGMMDMDVQFGSAALFLDLKPSLTIGNLVEDAERLDSELMHSVAVRHSSGLEVVAAPSDMLPIDAITPEFVDQALRTATQSYDVVLVDLPTVWNEWTVRALQRADAIVMVTNLTVPGIYQARRQLDVLDANGLMPKLQMVANRVPHGLFGGKVDLKETEAVLGRKIDHSIANDFPAVSAANDEGRTLKEVRGKSRIVKDLQQLADRLGETLSALARPQ
jgi:pilus assembly protein CpaE